ncbi:MAG: lysophospholipid acyltransferase family protein [Planctomycetes bacterium]|nr:lysophospholipid acyltransferase family protein [Planctomycetota bacterium]
MQRLPLRTALFLGDCLGLFAYYAFPRRRRHTHQHLRMALGNQKTPAELKQIAVRMAKNLGRNVAEFLRLPMLNEKNIDGYIEWSGLENLKEALALNRGALMLTAHFGNWDLAAVACVLKGFPVNLITKYLKNETINRFWLDYRKKMKVKALYRAGTLREIVQSLRDNQLMGFVLDQNTKREDGIFVNFFGRPACTIPSLAVLSQRLNAPVVPILMVRRPGGRHRIFIEKHLLFQKLPDQDEAIRHNTQIYTDIIERYIRQYPDHWIWMHRRWKTQPNNPNHETTKV